MGLRIGILGTVKGWHTAALVRAAGELGHEVVPIDFRATSAEIGPGRAVLRAGEVELTSLDRIVVRSVPAGSLEQVIFRVDALHRLESSAVPVINPARVIEASVDKYLAAARLAAAGIPVPRTAVCESARDALEFFGAFGGPVVIKPLFGAEGRGIILVEEREMAYRAMRTLEQLGSVQVVQQFIDGPGYDWRAFVIGGRVVASMKRFRAPGDFRTNVSQGGRAESSPLPAEAEELAIASARAVGALVAGVDLIPDREGRLHVLELNSSPGFRALSAVTGRDLARELISFAASYPA